MKKKKATMSCQEIKHSIKRYLMNEMKLEEAEQFVKHIRSCEECKKELEEYYAFSTVLMPDSMLETEKGNFSVIVEQRLEQTEKNVEKVRKDYIKRRLVYGFVAIVIAAAMSISIGG